MSLKYTAIANAATWPSVTPPSATPCTNSAISLRLNGCRSRFLRMISCINDMMIDPTQGRRP
jgi:hypothetical protein